MTKAQTFPAQTPAAFNRHLGQRLARRRRELNKSAADLDRAISAPAGSVARFEDGSRSMGAALLFALSGALGVPVLYFFEGLPALPEGHPVEAPSTESIADVERFLDAYFKIPDAKVRRDILGLLKAAAGAGEAA